MDSLLSLPISQSLQLDWSCWNILTVKIFCYVCTTAPLNTLSSILSSDWDVKVVSQWAKSTLILSPFISPANKAHRMSELKCSVRMVCISLLLSAQERHSCGLFSSRCSSVPLSVAGIAYENWSIAVVPSQATEAQVYNVKSLTLTCWRQSRRSRLQVEKKSNPI